MDQIFSKFKGGSRKGYSVQCCFLAVLQKTEHAVELRKGQFLMSNLFNCLYYKLINIFLSDLLLVVKNSNFASYGDGNNIFNFVEDIDNVSASMSLQSCHCKYGQSEYFSGFWIIK